MKAQISRAAPHLTDGPQYMSRHCTEPEIREISCAAVQGNISFLPSLPRSPLAAANMTEDVSEAKGTRRTIYDREEKYDDERRCEKHRTNGENHLKTCGSHWRQSLWNLRWNN